MRIINHIASKTCTTIKQPRRAVHSLRRRFNQLPLPKTQDWTQKIDVCVICPAYPGEDHPYGGQFVASRVRYYLNHGLSCAVIVSREDTVNDKHEQVDGVAVWRTHPKRLARYLDTARSRRVVLHHPEAANWKALQKHAHRTRPLVIFHGYEARPWRLLESSYSEQELKVLAPELDRRDHKKRMTLRSIFSHPAVQSVFVSDTLREVATVFAGQPTLKRALTIHNPVFTTEMSYQRKQIEDRFRILWVRSFRSHNYANDIARDALLRISGNPLFSKLSISVHGDGPLWDSITKPLQHLQNVELNRGFADSETMAELYTTHGVLMIPSRWESQGLTCSEGMAMGLVPITSNVAAVPEFVSEAEGYVCPAEDAHAHGAALLEIARNPKDFLARSNRSAVRMRRQCGADQTVDRELELLK